jgi:hypothetical protein
MGNDVLPGNDAQFEIFQAHFITTLTKSPAKFGVTAEDVAALAAAQKGWSVAYPAHLKAQQDAQAATQTKNTVRGSFEAVLRMAAQKVSATAGADNSLRAAAGLPVRVETRTVVGAPVSRPIGRLEASGSRTLVLHFTDEATPNRLAKPAGVRGAEIFYFVGAEAPADPDDYTFLALDTRTPYTHEHEPADVGKLVHYVLRWQNTKGETGPFGAAVSAKVPL